MSNRKFALWFVVLLVVAAAVYLVGLGPAVNPEHVHGKWTGKQKVTVRFDFKDHFEFLSSPDSLQLVLVLHENGDVTGGLGTATLEGCTLSPNRNKVSSAMNLFSDFVIRGSLKGSLFPGDTIPVKHISIPLNLEVSDFKGTVFQHQGIGAYPMVIGKLKRTE